MEEHRGNDERDKHGESSSIMGEHRGTTIVPRNGSPERKIYISQLSAETTAEKLADHFKKYGEITDAVVIKDRRNGMGRDYGFVTFVERSAIDNVLTEEHVLDGKRVSVKRSRPRKTNKLFVGRLAQSVLEEELKNYFRAYGNVVEARVVQCPVTGRSKEFGFVTFDSEETVEEILTLAKIHRLGGQEIHLKKADARESTYAGMGERGVSPRYFYGYGWPQGSLCGGRYWEGYGILGYGAGFVGGALRGYIGHSYGYGSCVRGGYGGQARGGDGGAGSVGGYGGRTYSGQGFGGYSGIGYGRGDGSNCIGGGYERGKGSNRSSASDLGSSQSDRSYEPSTS